MPILRRPLLKFIALLALAAGTGLSLAAQSEDAAPINLYAFERVVPDQSAATRKAAVSDALEEVLVRVSGDREISRTDAGKALLGDAGDLLDQYSYTRQVAPPTTGGGAGSAAGAAQSATQSATQLGKPTDNPAGNPATTPPSTPTTLLVLHGQFNARSIRTRLRAGGQALWAQPRPRLNVLLLVDNGHGDVEQLSADVSGADGGVAATATISAGAPGAAGKDGAEEETGAQPVDPESVLDEVASARGLSVTLLAPLPGAPSALWQQSVQSLPDAAGLGAQALLLVGRVTHKDATWAAGWALVQGGQVLDQWEHYAASLPEVLTMGAQKAVDWLAQRYAVRSGPGEENDIALQVTGVSTLADYARVQRYLHGLDIARSVLMLRASGDALEFRLRVDGGATALTNTLRLGGLLQPAPQPADTSAPGWGGGVHLTYTLRSAPASAGPSSTAGPAETTQTDAEQSEPPPAAEQAP